MRDRRGDRATSPVVGVLMMVAVAMPTVLGLALYLDAYERNMAAQKRAAERAAWCAEHPNRAWPGEGSCPTPGPRGWVCDDGETVEPTLKCVPVDDEDRLEDIRVVRDAPCEETQENVTGSSTRCR